MDGENALSRREFGAVLAAAPLAAGAVAGPRSEPRRGATVRDAAPLEARPFPLKQVRLLRGTCYTLQDRNRHYLHTLDSERLLHTFRLQAGLPSEAEQLGGWERPDIELRGHFMGHYLSACGQMYSSTGDELLKSKARAIVAELGKCQKANGEGWLAAFPPEFMQRLKERMPVWAPWYTLHKSLAGLLDMYGHCGDERALDIALGTVGWAKRWADPLTDEEMNRILEVEYGGMNEVLYNLYAVTGHREHFDLAHRFDQARIFDPLAEGRDELKGQHANTNLAQLIGAARRYELTGEERYRRIVEFFWQQVALHRSYCTGGTSNQQRWRTGPDVLASELGATTQECCCTHNMLKLTRHVFGWNPEAVYADFYERAFFNGILGTMNPSDAMTTFYVPLESGYWKLFSLPFDSFWCCTGTGVESFSKLGDSIFFHDDRGLYVNLFVPARVHWPEKGLYVRQETRFPDDDTIRLEFQCERPVALSLRVRVPYWATQGLAVRLNGQPQRASAKPASYWALERTWRNGDRLEVSLPMTVHAHPMPDDPTVQAFMYGPLVLAGALGNEGLTYDMMYANPVNARRGEAMRGEPVPAPDLVAPSADPADWIRPAGGPAVDMSGAEVVAGSPVDLTKTDRRGQARLPHPPAAAPPVADSAQPPLRAALRGLLAGEARLIPARRKSLEKDRDLRARQASHLPILRDGKVRRASGLQAQQFPDTARGLKALLRQHLPGQQRPDAVGSPKKLQHLGLQTQPHGDRSARAGVPAILGRINPASRCSV
jgi:DUF1680 family protein